MKRRLQRQLIYDAAQRGLHWWLALSTLILALTGLTASNLDAGSARAFLWQAHMTAGKALIIGFVGRFVWGCIGPRHALLTALFYPRVWLDSLRTRQMQSADQEFGHHPQASASYVGYYGLLTMMMLTGLVLAAVLHGEGPLGDRLLDDFAFLEPAHVVHEYAWWAIAFFVVTHVGALIFHEHRDGIPIAQSMISGFQYRTIDESTATRTTDNTAKREDAP